MLNRLTGELENHQPIEQAGFRVGYSTLNHIHVVEQTIEKYLEYRRPLYLAFHFHSISHNSIWKTLHEQNIHIKYINIIKNIYHNSTSKIKLDRLGSSINIQKVVRQGDPLSPKLFIAELQNIIKKLPWTGRGININGKLLSHLRFADDIVLFSETSSQLSKMIDELVSASKEVGFEVNTSKTKLMTNSMKNVMYIESEPLEYVDQYVYLGKQLSFKTERNIEELDRRVATTLKKYWSQKEIMKSQAK